MNKQLQQRGISIPMVLAIISITMIVGLTFMGVVRLQTERAGFEQATITSAYVAEIGFQQVRARLSPLNGDWTQLPDAEIEKDCTAGNTNRARCQHSPIDASDFSNLHPVYENPLDTSSRIIGRYEYIIETGQKRSAAFGNRTATGSTVGYVPGSALPAEQVGYDVYGNKLCDETVAGGSCPAGFVGIKVKAWLTDSSGNELPKSRPQTVYGVLSTDSRDPDDEGPSGYMLESNTSMQIGTSSNYNPDSGRIEAFGGFYGPVHTNENFKFVWESKDKHAGNDYPGNYVVRKYNDNQFDSVFPNEPARGLSSPPLYNDYFWRRPFWGVLMADLGAQYSTAPRIREENNDFGYLTYGRIFKIMWNPSESPPPSGASYDVFFRKPDGTNAVVTATRSGTLVDENIQSPLMADSSLSSKSEAWPLVGIEYAGTTYPNDSSNVKYYANSAHYIGWDYDTGTVREFSPSERYRVRFISHSPIEIHNEMTYAGGAPEYRYYHTHPMTSSWPFYQTAHGHTNLLGADLAANTTSDYDTTTWTHSHIISNDVSQDPITSSSSATAENTFLKFDSTGYKPILAGRHEIPLLRPESDITNYKNQLEQLNQYLRLTLGATLPENSDGSINATPLTSAPFNATNYEKGYIVGKFPSTMPSTTPSFVDFRAVYFGERDMTYTSGSNAGARIISDTDPYTETKRIWVDDNPTSPTYMHSSDAQENVNYKSYLFRQIPAEKVILVRDAAVLIGNLKPQGAGVNCVGLTTKGPHCLPFLPGYASSAVGESTIIDGQLTILSFTTNPPADPDEYSQGDIIVVGNVLYNNSFFKVEDDQKRMRQFGSTPESPYSIASPTNINTIGVEWVTNEDGTLSRDASGNLIGKWNGLGLLATHDVKISVTPMGNGYQKATFSLPDCNIGRTIDDFYDSMTIHGQIVAGNRVRVHGFVDGTTIPDLQDIDLVGLCTNEAPYESQKDSLTFYGTLYSREAPNFSEYFRVRRSYFFDESLEKNPLVGAPYYPKTAGDYKNQTIFNNYASLVPGTWKQGVN